MIEQAKNIIEQTTTPKTPKGGPVPPKTMRPAPPMGPPPKALQEKAEQEKASKGEQPEQKKAKKGEQEKAE